MKKIPISKDDLMRLSAMRYDDAQQLHEHGRYDGAIYMCGYTIELRLKLTVANTLNWDGYPRRGDKFKAFYEHDLDFLLAISGRDAYIRQSYSEEWSTVARWDPSMRYDTASAPRTEEESRRMLDATIILGNALSATLDVETSEDVM